MTNVNERKYQITVTDQRSIGSIMKQLTEVECEHPCSKDIRTVNIKNMLIKKVYTNKNLPKCAYPVFLYLLTVLNSDYPIMIKQTEIYNKIGYDKSNISKAIKALIAEEIIEKRKTANRKKGYILSL